MDQNPNSIHHFEVSINSQNPVLVYFYADWAPPCEAMNSLVDDVSEELGERIEVVKVNIERSPFIADAYGVKNIPALKIFQVGSERWKHQGPIDKKLLLDTLRDFAENSN
jgi:thioredoxin 1